MDEKNTIQAVILAAGKGTRMHPLTVDTPKSLQVVNGKTLIEWKLAALPKEVKEVILVIGHQGDQIRGHLGDSWGGKTIRYVEQKELNGTAGALLSARSLLRERFLVMMGDDLYAKEDIEKLITLPWGICVSRVHNKEMGGEMLVDDKGNFVGIREDKHLVTDGLVNTGLYILGREILDIPPVPIGGTSKEFGLPHTLAVIARETPVPLIITDHWMQITGPDDLIKAQKYFLG